MSRYKRGDILNIRDKRWPSPIDSSLCIIKAVRRNHGWYVVLTVEINGAEEEHTIHAACLQRLKVASYGGGGDEPDTLRGYLRARDEA